VKTSKYPHDLGNYQKTHVKYKNIPKCKPDFLSYLRPKVYFNYTLIIIKKPLSNSPPIFLIHEVKKYFYCLKVYEKSKNIFGQ
jgi:hypothetical protein